METRLGYYSVMQMRYHLDYLMDYYLANSMVNWMGKHLVNSTGMTMDCLMVTNSVTTTDSPMRTFASWVTTPKPVVRVSARSAQVS